MSGQRKDQKKFNELVKELKDKKFKYEQKDEKQINWSKYDKAQSHIFSFFYLIYLAHKYFDL